MRSARRKRRLGSVLMSVAVLAAAYPLWHSLGHGANSAPTPPELTVDYRTSTASATAAVATPQVFVTNTSAKPIPLGDVAIRYYFTADGASFGFNCVQAGVGCSNITGTVGTLDSPAATADRFVQIGFAPGAGTLAPGHNSQGVELQLYRLDRKDLDQHDDWSFDPSSTTYKPNPHVTGYLHGAHVWGDEPAGASALTDTTPAAAPPATTPAIPAGTVFDDFHYTGADDPALLAHGWRARTGPGGPGITGTWSSAAVTFPATASAEGGQALQLRAATDGTAAGTQQAELQSTDTEFFTGTYAARIHFTDRPGQGADGDHVSESFYPISSTDESALYSELDDEYMPNGGWGAPGPVFDTTSWYSAALNERATHRVHRSLQGWHTVMITAMDGAVTYCLDGKVLFTSRGKYFPREDMGIHFNEWFINLPFTGQRGWDMQVNWFYYRANETVSFQEVQQAVSGLYAQGTNFINTLTPSGD